MLTTRKGRDLVSISLAEIRERTLGFAAAATAAAVPASCWSSPSSSRSMTTAACLDLTYTSAHRCRGPGE